LAELRGFVRAVENEEWYVTVKDRETRVDRSIYRPAYETAVAVLPKVRDEELIREAENVLEKANEAAEKPSDDKKSAFWLRNYHMFLRLAHTHMIP